MSNNARSDALSVRRERGHSNAYLRSSDLPMTCRRACACVLAASIQQRGWLAKDPIKYANLLGIFGISFDFCTYNTQTRPFFRLNTRKCLESLVFLLIFVHIIPKPVVWGGAESYL